MYLTGEAMNPDTARSIIKAVDAVIGCAAFIWFHSNISSQGQIEQSISARIFRTLGSLLVGILYLMSAAWFIFGYFAAAQIDTTVYDKHGLAGLVGYDLGTVVPGLLFLYLAYWGHTRLKRHSA